MINYQDFSVKMLKAFSVLAIAYYIVPRFKNYLYLRLILSKMGEHHVIINSLKNRVFEHLDLYAQTQIERGKPLRVLELGIGGGLNLEFYPNPTQIVAVDPLEGFRNSVESRISELNSKTIFNTNLNSNNLFSSTRPWLELEEWFTMSAEQLTVSQNDSSTFSKESHSSVSSAKRPVGPFDAFVCSFVLCSVDNAEQVILDAATLVKPGGLIIIIDHIKPRRMFVQILAYLWQPIHYMLFYHCHLLREPHKLFIKNSKIQNVWESVFCETHDYSSKYGLNMITNTLGLVARRR